MTEWQGPGYVLSPQLRERIKQAKKEGRDSLTAAADVANGSMIALVPSDADLDRLVISGGEARGQLHLTLAFLGEGISWDPEQRDAVVLAMQDLPQAPVVGTPFGVAQWNPTSPDAAWVLNVGGEDLETAHGAVWDKLRSLESEVKTPPLPEQHAPWVPHICLAYSQDDLLAEATQRVTGDVRFDRLRVAFAGEITDLPLSESITSSATSTRLPRDGGVIGALEEVARRALQQGS